MIHALWCIQHGTSLNSCSCNPLTEAEAIATLSLALQDASRIADDMARYFEHDYAHDAKGVRDIDYGMLIELNRAQRRTLEDALTRVFGDPGELLPRDKPTALLDPPTPLDVEDEDIEFCGQEYVCEEGAIAQIPSTRCDSEFCEREPDHDGDHAFERFKVKWSWGRE